MTQMDGITPDWFFIAALVWWADAINELIPLFIKHNNTHSVPGPVLGTAGAMEGVRHTHAIKESTIWREIGIEYIILAKAEYHS